MASLRGERDLRCIAHRARRRIRHTSVSVPYHIRNGWGGGLVPLITTAAFQATGSIGYALIYPIAVPAVCFVLSLFLMPETRHISIWRYLQTGGGPYIRKGQ